LFVSLLRETASGRVADSAKDDGIAEVKETVMVGAMMVMLATIVLVESFTDVAVMLIAPPAGTADGEL